MLFETLRNMKRATEHLNYGRQLIADFASRASARWPHAARARVLDIGCGTGTDLNNIRQALAPRPLDLYGVERYEPNIAAAAQYGIDVRSLNIEHDRLPFDDRLFDLIVANQIVEHTKQIFWMFSEISRVLKPGGAVIVGVPNLASLHNRVLLALGEQPTTIELLGPHVRGITKNAFKRFITADGYFKLLAVKGSNFYPFPPRLAQTLSRLLPTLAVGLFFLCERTDKSGEFARVLDTRFFETDYYAGPGPAPRA